jgi:hypothetical protein
MVITITVITRMVMINTAMTITVITIMVITIIVIAAMVITDTVVAIGLLLSGGGVKRRGAWPIERGGAGAHARNDAHC